MLLRFLIRLLGVALALLAIASFVPGITVASFYTALVVSVFWGIISLTLKPLLNLAALPINLLTLGLFSFVINALLFWFLASFVKGFAVAGFMPALVGSLVLSAVVWALHKII